MRPRTNLFRVIFLSVVLLISGAATQEPIAREFQIKAVFLFNFTQFVQWPSTAFEHSDSPLVIGIVGDDPFGSYLDETLRNEKIENHSLVVERYASIADIADCHILFIALSARQGMRGAVEAMKSKPVLTVSDEENFTKVGGMVRFYNENGRIRLRINVEPATNSGLTISSKLLRLADVVPSNGN